MQTLFFEEGCLLRPHHFFCGVVIELVRVGFSNSYQGTTDDAAILRVTGESRNRWDRLRQTALPARSRLLRDARPGGMQINGSAFFKQSFELKIKGDLIPEAAAKEILDKMLPVAAGVQTKLGRGGTGEE